MRESSGDWRDLPGPEDPGSNLNPAKAGSSVGALRYGSRSWSLAFDALETIDQCVRGVVLFLVLHVLDHGRQGTFGEAEGAVFRLPGKSSCFRQALANMM